MENDDFFITKKTGMTITKAWILFVSMFLLYFLIGAVIGVMQAMGGSKLEPKEFMVSTMLINFVTTSIMCVIAYFVNLKELPRFKMPSINLVLLVLWAGIVLRFALSIVEEIPFSLIDSKTLESMTTVGPFLLFLPALVLLIFQVGFIGHGLLRNYGFSTALITTVLVSIVNFELKSIISMMILTGFGLFIYYKTSSFWLYLTLIVPYFFMDVIISKFVDMDLFAMNNYRKVVIGNDVVYYVLLGLSLLFLIAIGWYINKQKSQDWKRTDALPEF